jgi:outer membrane protein TolC
LVPLLALPLLALPLLTGCAGSQFTTSLAQTNQDTAALTHGQLQLAQDDAMRAEMAARAAELLQQPLSADGAIQLSLLNHPLWQALLAEHRFEAARAAQAGRIPNPVFSFTRLWRGDAIDIERSLSFGLFDLLLLPQRQQLAQQGLAQAQLGLSLQVLERATQVRQAWVRAVARQQSLAYAQQVFESAQAGAELAQRLQAAGNFSKLMSARQQAYSADAMTSLTSARQEALAAREALVRALGLSASQAQQLQLPPRLPDLPATPRPGDDVAKAASSARLDIRIAQAQLASAAKEQGLSLIPGISDIEIGLRRDSSNSGSSGAEAPDTRGHGYELSLRLPVFDSGNLQREAMNANTLARAQRLQALLLTSSSSLRESHAAYLSSYQIAKHYHQQILPLKKTIAAETLLRYNGMLASVFDLLAEARSQAGSVMATIQAEEQFWLADAALQANIVGAPMASEPGGMLRGNDISGNAASAH